jgi:integrase
MKYKDLRWLARCSWSSYKENETGKEKLERLQNKGFLVQAPVSSSGLIIDVSRLSLAPANPQHRANDEANNMTVLISEKHLKAGESRKTYSDKDVKGFALRTTPNGVFTYYYQHLNKATGKRDWHKIGDHPEWSVAKARNEARRLAGLAADDKDIRQIRRQKAEQARVGSITFQQLHDEYITYCKTPVTKRWGKVPQKESWQDIQSALKRPLEWWSKILISEITDDSVMELYNSFVREDHIPQANRVRGMLHTLFEWAAQTPRKYIPANPCANLPKKLDEPSDVEDGRVLTADEIRTFWFGVDDPNCPGDRLSKLALKLSLATLLRTGEIVEIESTGVGPSTVTIPLKVLKGRRSKKARDVVQPLNSLAKEILGEVFAGDENRRHAFPGTGKRRGMGMKQQTLAHLLIRRDEGKGNHHRPGILQYLGMAHWTPHALRRTGATILDQLGYTEGEVGKVLTHKTSGKDASPVTSKHYIVKKPIIARPVDKRIEMLDALDEALREILDLPIKKALPKPLKLLTAA